jgi:predicted membrane protein (TIGR00267 family)
MMAFELNLTKPHPAAAMICGLVMSISYSIGGIIPMLPYFFISQINHALFASIGITVIVLIVFGYAKAAIGGSPRNACWVSSFQTLCVGALAAGSSYGIVYAINQKLFGGDQAPPLGFHHG